MSVTHPAPVVPSAASASTAIAGITMCTNCRARFRVQQKHVALVGKSMRCPKCHNQFVLQLEVPTAVEEAAISNAEQQETCCESEQPPRPKRKVRTRSQIKKQTLSAIKRGMRPFHSRLSQLAAQDRCSEEQVRVWVIDVLRTVLGYKIPRSTPSRTR